MCLLNLLAVGRVEGLCKYILQIITAFWSNLCENIHLMATNFVKIIVQFVKFIFAMRLVEEREERKVRIRNQNE